MLLANRYPTNLTLTTPPRNSGVERIEQLIKHRQLSIIVNATCNMLQEGSLTTTTSKTINTPQDTTSSPSTFLPPYLCNEQPPMKALIGRHKAVARSRKDDDATPQRAPNRVYIFRRRRSRSRCRHFAVSASACYQGRNTREQSKGREETENCMEQAVVWHISERRIAC